MTDDLIARLRRAPTHKVLRFSTCSVAGRRGYVWGEVRTDSEDTVQLLLALWNNRAAILDALTRQ